MHGGFDHGDGNFLLCTNIHLLTKWLGIYLSPNKTPLILFLFGSLCNGIFFFLICCSLFDVYFDHVSGYVR